LIAERREFKGVNGGLVQGLRGRTTLILDASDDGGIGSAPVEGGRERSNLLSGGRGGRAEAGDVGHDLAEVLHEKNLENARNTKLTMTERVQGEGTKTRG
jgi:hypothetical protein